MLLDPVDSPRPITALPALPVWRRVRFTLGCVVVVGWGVALPLHLIVASEAKLALWGFELLGAAGVCLAVYGMTRWWWDRPMRELRHLMGAIRAGAAPIESLADVRRGPRALVPVVRELLRELREQRRDLAALHEEIRQRVAQRTDALERTIGNLRHQATRDALTGLFNRRFFDTYLPQVVRRCAEQKAEVTVVMADLDHFKLLNDTLGHAAGDELLRSVGQLIRSTVRGEDASFRVGGDEFVIVMPHSSTTHGKALAERLSSLVDALGRTYKLPARPRLSVGVACITDLADRSPAELMSQADKALYACKAARRGDLKPIAKDRTMALQAAGSSLQCRPPSLPHEERGLTQ